MALALAATLDVDRLAAILHLTGIAAGADTVTIERRSPSGNVAAVRGADNATVTPPTFMAHDFELPLDVPVTYTATVYDGSTVMGTATVDFTIAYDSCEAWLVDIARPTNSLPLVIESLTELDYPVPSGIYRVLDRRAPVVVALPAQTPATELIVLTETLEERDRTRNLLGSGYPFLVRTAPEQGIGNIYFALSEFVEERFISLGTAPERRFRIQAVQVERPDPGIYIPLAPNTYANVKTSFASYAALLAGVASYEALAYIYPTGVTNPITPWPPTDI